MMGTFACLAKALPYDRLTPSDLFHYSLTTRSNAVPGAHTTTLQLSATEPAWCSSPAGCKPATGKFVHQENSDIVSWEDNGQSFIIWQPAEFSRDLLPQYFKHSNLASFVRQLNTYGFQKASPDRWEFHHPNFKRSHPEQLTNIPRRRTAHKPHHAASEGFVDHGLAAQVHALKQDKRMIMLELLKLQQTQERAQKEAEQLNGRLLRTEQNQQRLMTCLAAAVQDPSILRNMLAASSERGALADSPGIAGKKRARSWQEDATDSDSDSPRDKQMELQPQTASRPPLTTRAQKASSVLQQLRRSACRART
ncbi:hypothetical protein WJX73_002218 [Symbiochloris irregularis]|uniref:HSF-type DNA-binding domain-containing protein n=1 Tax=Symbiochloris irregularis TaxID=706552 RepID=A0AAW1NVE7_9CHLO